MAQEIELIIPAFPYLRESAQTISLSRVNVVLGLNGSGKSKLLKALENQAQMKQIPVLRIQGDRFQRAPYATAVSAGHIETHKGRLVEAYELEYRNKDNGNRIEKAFRLLAARDFVAHKEYTDSVVHWFEGDRKEAEEPQKPEPEIQKLLNSVTKLLPHIEFVNHKDGYIQARYKKQNPYHVHEISDGEREIICNFIDIWVGTPGQGLLLVDEPELHLHPSLACNFWNLVEERFPTTTILYATHFIGFALRSSVNKLFHIGHAGRVVELPKFDSLSRQEKTDFLGAIPGILQSSKILFCEGVAEGTDCTAESSFDIVFYAWLLKDHKITIIPSGTGDAVIAAVKAARIIHQMSGDVSIAGVIDRDDYPDERIKSRADFVEVLIYHEAESYLCIFELLLAVAKSNGVLIDEAELIQLLIEYAREKIGTVASRRFKHRIGKRDDEYYGAMKEEEKLLNDALDSKNPDKILRYFHGKEMASKFARVVGCDSAKQLLLRAMDIIKPNEIAVLASLRKSILERLTQHPIT